LFDRNIAVQFSVCFCLSEEISVTVVGVDVPFIVLVFDFDLILFNVLVVIERVCPRDPDAQID
jgi:hypothetical protein